VLKSFKGGVLAKTTSWHIVTEGSSGYKATDTSLSSFNSYYGDAEKAYFAIDGTGVLVITMTDIGTSVSSYDFDAMQQLILPSDNPEYDIIVIGVKGPELKALAVGIAKAEDFDVSGIPIITEQIMGKAGDLLVTKSDVNGITYFHLYKVGFNVGPETTTTTTTQTTATTATTTTTTATNTTTTTTQTTTTPTTGRFSVPFIMIMVPFAAEALRRIRRK
jgi:asparagine N-glycosylation enzyme membrane subunit Stt3